MGVYLFGMGTADSIFHGHYVLLDTRWRQSALCKSLGGLPSLSLSLSLYTKFALALFYLNAIKSMKKGIGRQGRVFIGFCIALWPIGITLNYMPLFDEDAEHPHTCMLFMSSGRLSWGVHLGVNICLNLCVLHASLVPQAILMRLVLASGGKMRKSGGLTKWKSVQMIVIRMTCDLLVWISLETFLVIFAIDRMMYLHTVEWVTGFLLPVNAIVNPCIFTFREILKNWASKKEMMKK